MEYILVILALLCAVAGLLGAVLPALPGPPLSFVGLLLLLPCPDNDIETATVIATGIAAAIITVLDYVAPIWLAKKKGGSKYGTWGAGIGMFVGLFLGPWGIMLGPFAGAFIGEIMAKNSTERALTTAFMSFVAFMLTTGIKFIFCFALIVMIVVEGWKIIWD